jgi:hypothetical protein
MQLAGCNSLQTPQLITLCVRRSFLRRLQDLLNFFYQLSSSKWRRKYPKPFQVRSVLKPIIIQKTSYYKDPHLWVPCAQVFGSFVPRNVVEVGMGNQQVDLALSERVDGCP